MRVALVYDRVNKFGGAERVLLALHEIWPEAPLYTSVWDPDGAPWAKVFDVRPSFLQHMPLAAKHHELYPWLTPLAFETFNFDAYDVVISVTSAEAKSIITKPGTLHVCYCLTPTRYLWSGYEAYRSYPGMGMLSFAAVKASQWIGPHLRRWDRLSAERPDSYIAISHRVAERIKTYYKRDVAEVIYPPVDLEKFRIKDPNAQKRGKNSYFLVVSRLVGYKRVDIVVDAFNTLGWPLVIIGDGWARDELMKSAHGNIHFVSAHLTDTELVGYYQNCRAFVFAGDEDFGLVAVEAQACGKPVVAFRGSGIAEIVLEGKTGLLFDKQTGRSLVGLLKRFDKHRFDAHTCRESALRFDKTLFTGSMKQVIENLYKQDQQEQYS